MTFFRTIVQQYRNRRGDGSAMTLFWLLTGVVTVTAVVLSISIVMPKDMLRGYVVDDPATYIHFRNPKEIGFFAASANELALVFKKGSAEPTILMRLEKNTRAPEGFEALGNEVYVAGDRSVVVASNTPRKTTLLFPLWSVTGEVRTEKGLHKIIGFANKQRIRGVLAAADQPAIDLSLFGILSKCSPKTTLEATKDYIVIAKGDIAEGNLSASIVFEDILAYAAQFIAYENPFTLEARANLQGLFAADSVIGISMDNEPIAFFKDARPGDVKEVVLDFIRYSLPVIQKKTLPDKTAVQEFVLQPTAYAWSEPDEQGIVSLVSSEKRSELYLWYSSEGVAISPSLTTLRTFIQRNGTVLFEDFSTSLVLNGTALGKLPSVSPFFSTIPFSTFYAHGSVDKSIMFCGSFKK